MSESTLNQDAIILHEMLAHIPLFIHRKPQHVVVLNDCNQGITREIMKHPSVIEVWQNTDHESIAANSLDVLIIADQTLNMDYPYYFKLLRNEGLLIQLSASPVQLSEIKRTQQYLKDVGFQDILPLQFPAGRSAIMAIKEGTIRRPREKDIFNKSFTTHYYNLDVHRAAFALPEFMRLELEV